jgi:hypothetical protein
LVSPPFPTGVAADPCVSAPEITGAEGGVASIVTTIGEDVTVLVLVVVLDVAVNVNVPSLKLCGTNVKVPAVDVSVAKPSDIPSLKTSTSAPVEATINRTGDVLLVKPLLGKFVVKMGFVSPTGGWKMKGIIGASDVDD